LGNVVFVVEGHDDNANASGAATHNGTLEKRCELVSPSRRGGSVVDFGACRTERASEKVELPHSKRATEEAACAEQSDIMGDYGRGARTGARVCLILQGRLPTSNVAVRWHESVSSDETGCPSVRKVLRRRRYRTGEVSPWDGSFEQFGEKPNILFKILE
jgi:hypothetical protein